MRLRNIPRADGVIKSHPMVVQDTQESRGNWKNIFENDRPVYLEIGMGKGRFLMNMAKEHPLVNFVGIERYSSVLLRALEKYDTEEYKDLQNIRFLCMDATEIENVFNQGEIRKIYLNFSDPWPKARHARRRLTSGTFLDRYAKILPPGGNLEFKTDNTELFRFSLEEIREKEGWRLDKYTYDLHRNDEMNQGNIMTEYEEKFSSLGNPINKLIATRL